MINNIGGEISQFYEDKCVFITGATGFMGKVLLHKLLNSCPGMDKIYVLVRPKRDVEPQLRLDKIFEGPLFKDLKETNPSCFKKVIACTGDITLPRLGISDEDLTTITQNVSVIFHSAATVKFDEELRKALIMNVEGTRTIIELAHKMLKLKALVHVSTAYANCIFEQIDERFYHNHEDPEKIIQSIHKMKDIDEKSIIGKHPNTYTFTKALAEQLVERAEGLPIAICRPSIVVASWKYPTKGWIDNHNGPTGLFAAKYKGISRTRIGKRSNVIDLIPVDVCINVMIVAAWKTAQENAAGALRMVPSIYNITSGAINPITFGQMDDYEMSSIYKYPASTMIWYPGGPGSWKSAGHHRLLQWVQLYLPAFLIDAVNTVLRQPKWASKLSNQISTQIKVVQYFALNQWSWSHVNLDKLHNALVSTDENSLKTFDFDIRPLDWKSFMEHYILGIRHFVFKDSPDTIDSSRKKLKLYYVLHSILKAAFIFFIIYNLIGSFFF